MILKLLIGSFAVWCDSQVADWLSGVIVKLPRFFCRLSGVIFKLLIGSCCHPCHLEMASSLRLEEVEKKMEEVERDYIAGE